MSSPNSDSFVPPSLPPPSATLVWLPVACGLLLLYLPTFVDLGLTLWRTEEQGHGPLILAAALWLFWRQRAAWLTAETRPRLMTGLCMLAPGLLLYVVGRSQDIKLLEAASLIPVLAGALLMVQGTQALRALWFPLLYLGFMIPLPGILVDLLTGPLKIWVAEIVETLLYHAGYPIARIGVVLAVGQYQLQVADACSGLQSMISLAALGLFYMHLAGRQGWLHNGLLLASILPFALLANITRVLILVLVTYHFGDAAGQSFLHGFSGVVLMLAALLSIFALDTLLARLLK